MCREFNMQLRCAVNIFSLLITVTASETLCGKYNDLLILPKDYNYRLPPTDNVPVTNDIQLISIIQVNFLAQSKVLQWEK